MKAKTLPPLMMKLLSDEAPLERENQQEEQQKRRNQLLKLNQQSWNMQTSYQNSEEETMRVSLPGWPNTKWRSWNSMDAYECLKSLLKKKPVVLETTGSKRTQRKSSGTGTSLKNGRKSLKWEGKKMSSLQYGYKYQHERRKTCSWTSASFKNFFAFLENTCLRKTRSRPQGWSQARHSRGAGLYRLRHSFRPNQAALEIEDLDEEKVLRGEELQNCEPKIKSEKPTKKEDHDLAAAAIESSKKDLIFECWEV